MEIKTASVVPRFTEAGEEYIFNEVGHEFFVPYFVEGMVKKTPVSTIKADWLPFNATSQQSQVSMVSMNGLSLFAEAF